MSQELADEYRSMDAIKKAKKASNLEQSTKLLELEHIDFESKNNGVHLIVIDFNGNLIDFWPSTCKWIVRNGKTSRGVQNLIRHIKE